MNRSYRLPKGVEAARRSLAALVEIFGEKALGKPSIRAGRRSNKVRVRAPAGLHDDARSMIYLGLLDAAVMGSSA